MHDGNWMKGLTMMVMGNLNIIILASVSEVEFRVSCNFFTSVHGAQTTLVSGVSLPANEKPLTTVGTMYFYEELNY